MFLGPAYPARRVGPLGVSTSAGTRTIIALSLGVTFAIQGLTLVTGILLARELGPEGRGALAAVVLWPSLLAIIGSLGLSDALTFSAARREADRGALVGTAIGLALVQSAVLVGIGFVLEPIVLHRYDQSTITSAYLMLAFIPLSMAALCLMGALNGQGRMVDYHLLRGLVFLLTLLAVAAQAATDELTVRGGVLAYVVANALTFGVAYVRAAQRRPPLRFERPLARRLLAFGVRSHASNVTVVLNARLDQLLVSLFLAPRLLGLYTVAATLSLAVSLVGASLAPVALATIPGESSLAVRRQRACALTSTTVILSVAIVVPLLLILPQAIELAFGQPFRPAADAGRILLLAGAVMSLNRTLGGVLKGIGRPLDAGLAELVALATTMASLAILLPLFDLPGAAGASLAGALVSALLLLRRTTGSLGVSVRDLVLPSPATMGQVRAILRRA